MFYFETKNFRGQWRPNTSLNRPKINVEAGVKRLAAYGVGPEIRGVTAVPIEYEGKSLNFLRGKLSEHPPYRLKPSQKIVQNNG